MECEKSYDDYFNPDGSPRDDAAEQFHVDNFPEAVRCAHNRGSKDSEGIANQAIFEVWDDMFQGNRCDRVDARGKEETPTKRVLAIVRNLSADESSQSGRIIRAAEGKLESDNAKMTLARFQRYLSWIDRSTSSAPSAHDETERRERAERQICGFYDGIRQVVLFAEGMQNNAKAEAREATLRKRVVFEMASRGEDPTDFYHQIGVSDDDRWTDVNRIYKQLAVPNWRLVDTHNSYLHTWMIRLGATPDEQNVVAYEPTPFAQMWARRFMTQIDDQRGESSFFATLVTKDIFDWVVWNTDAFVPSERRRLEYKASTLPTRARMWDVEYYFKTIAS